MNQPIITAVFSDDLNTCDVTIDGHTLWWWNDDNGLFERTGVDKPEPLYYLSTTGKPVNWVEAGTRDAKVRSKTFQSIADAMASQWTDYLMGKQERMKSAS